jgi:hypothetical protein
MLGHARRSLPGTLRASDWSIGILLSGAITALLRLHLKNVFMGVAYGNAACSGFARRRATDVPLSHISDELPGQFDVPAFVSQGPFRKPVFPLRSKVPVHARADRF